MTTLCGKCGQQVCVCSQAEIARPIEQPKSNDLADFAEMMIEVLGKTSEWFPFSR